MSETKKTSGGLDFTSGEPTGLLIRFAIPMLIGAVFQMLYNMVDTIVLGRLVSTEALASVGATATTTGLVIMIGNSLTNGMSILISHAWGAKDASRVKKMVALSLTVCTCAGVLIGLLGFSLARPIMLLLGTPSNIINGSVTYVRIVCGLYIVQMFYNTAASILRAIGDSRTPLYFLVLCSLMNIVLDLLFVRLFANGIAAVACATILSQAVSAVLCCVYMWKKQESLRFTREDLRFDGKLYRLFFETSLPMTFQFVMLSLGQMVITSVINGFGSDTVAAYTVGGRVESLVTVIISQVAFSFSVYSGQNFGAKEYDRIDLGVKRAIGLLAVLTAFSMAILLGFTRPLVLLFIHADEEAIIALALQMLRVEACFMPALCMIWLFNSALRGMGKIKPTVISAMLELIGKIGLSLLLSRLMGQLGIWLSAPIGWVIGLIFSALYFYLSGWKAKAIAADLKKA